MGYQMNTRPRARPTKAAAAPPPAAPAAQQSQTEAAAVAELAPAAHAIPPGFVSVSAQPDEPFRDVVEPIVMESGTRQLLSGTELEAAPEKRGRPVPVVKPGQAVPLQLQTGSGAPQAAAVAAPQVRRIGWHARGRGLRSTKPAHDNFSTHATCQEFCRASHASSAHPWATLPPPYACVQAPPRPVPVVKPQKRATIGDMLRSAARSGDEDPYAEPYALVNGSGRSSGMSVGGGGSGGHTPQLSTPANPHASHQPAAAGAGGAFPVNTGSSYAAAAGGGSRGQAGGSDEAGPVQYNPDGSVVLASKPIKLVKPAHLLPKTYGETSSQAPASFSSAGWRGLPLTCCLVHALACCWWCAHPRAWAASLLTSMAPSHCFLAGSLLHAGRPMHANCRV